MFIRHRQNPKVCESSHHGWLANPFLVVKLAGGPFKPGFAATEGEVRDAQLSKRTKAGAANV
jgi:hypothetical protein